MAHHSQLKKTKFRQWVKAGLGLKYLREGIAPFCDDIVKQQHIDILNNIKQTKKISTVACGQCSWTTLRPDHAKGGNRSCKLGQKKCNCCTPAGKSPCPNKVCGAIYDAIVTNHGYTPPTPYWKNTETQHWCTDPWSIAKCFINVPGYEKKASAGDIDCIGLLNLIRNNQYFHNHIQCTIIPQRDIFAKVIADRNNIFHSSTMELEETEADSYIDNMIAVLQDGKKLKHRQESRDAIKKLEELKNKDLIITTENAEKHIRNVAEEEKEKLAARLENNPDPGDTLKKELKKQESVISKLEKEIHRLNVSSQKEQPDYKQSKLVLQKLLITYYREEILRMTVLPQQQECNLYDFNDVYVRPRMTFELNDKVRDVLSMSDIFTKDGKPIKSIYVLGEAGCGKSSFCKSLAHYWCLAHSDEEQIINDEFSGVKEMKKFDFLFLLPLGRYAKKTKILEMLEDKYEHPILKKLLEDESGTCLVVLDGLDEWAIPASKCLPERGALKEYTVLTTSRPWKIATLEISDYEIRKKIVIKGFDDEISLHNMIEKTVPILNKTFKEKKDPSDCQKALQDASFSRLTRTAITLQQLICLWFDGKLRRGTTKCAIYTEMLDLLFKWHERKDSDNHIFNEMKMKSKDMKTVELPHAFKDTEVCKSYSYIILDVSRLAYETLFNKLPCDSSTFERLEILDEVKTCCLKVGILSEDKVSKLSASESRKSVVAFIHKSFQEYLAAVFITIVIKCFIAPEDSGNEDFPDPCTLLITDFFSNCSTLNKILEQANVFIKLCSLEPRIARSIIKFINKIATLDKRVLEYRRTIDNSFRHYFLILNIQKCILNCIKGVKSCETSIQSNFYLGDILRRASDYDDFRGRFHKKFISPESVISFRIEGYKLKRALKYLLKCQRLEALTIYTTDTIEDEDIKCICYAIEGNTSTLKALCLDGLELTCRATVRRLPDMSHLVALKIENINITLEDFISVCNFLSSSSHLEQISIFNTPRKQSLGREIRAFREQNRVDLSKHQQLQYLKYDGSVTVTRVYTTNLEIIECFSLKITNDVKVFDNLSTAYNLTKLHLKYSKVSSDKTPSYHTHKLIELFPLLQKLRELILLGFTFTDNIMKYPSEMKSMKFIHLEAFKMSLETWQEFVDSLPLIPLSVEVEAVNMCVTNEDPPISFRKAGEEESHQPAAQQYVKEKENEFEVLYVITNLIYFLTKKENSHGYESYHS